MTSYLLENKRSANVLKYILLFTFRFNGKFNILAADIY